MYLSLGQAAKETGKSKSVISNAIKSGRLSAVKGEKGEWNIDPAELFRVYPIQNAKNPKKEQNSTSENPLENRLLTQEIEHLKEQLKREREIVRSLEVDRDHWRQQATALLTDQRQRPTDEGRLSKAWAALRGKL